jgi:hypothetical protein
MPAWRPSRAAENAKLLRDVLIQNGVEIVAMKGVTVTYKVRVTWFLTFRDHDQFVFGFEGHLLGFFRVGMHAVGFFQCGGFRSSGGSRWRFRRGVLRLR